MKSDNDLISVSSKNPLPTGRLSRSSVGEAAPISYHFQLRLCHMKAALLPQLMSQILPAFRVLPVPIGLKLGNPDFACFVDDIHFWGGHRPRRNQWKSNPENRYYVKQRLPARKRERSLPAPGGLSAVVPAVCRENICAAIIDTDTAHPYIILHAEQEIAGIELSWRSPFPFGHLLFFPLQKLPSPSVR